VQDEEREQISECWQDIARGGAGGAGAGRQLTPEELTGGGGKVAMGFVEIMLGVWRCDEGYDCTVLGQGSDRAENVINSNAIERKFSLDI
jgi:hypothetical protein